MPPSPWRAPGLIAWEIYEQDTPTATQALSELDEGFARAVEVLKRDLGRGLAPERAVARAFDSQGGVLFRWAGLGALDTEACANTRLALREFAERVPATR